MRTAGGCDSGEAQIVLGAEGAKAACPLNLSGKRTEDDGGLSGFTRMGTGKIGMTGSFADDVAVAKIVFNFGQWGKGRLTFAFFVSMVELSGKEKGEGSCGK